MDQPSNIYVPEKHRPRPGDWPPESVLLLVELFSRGYSMGAIGNRVNRTRNAVAGQIRKLRRKGIHNLEFRVTGRKTKVRERSMVPTKPKIAPPAPELKPPRIRLQLIESPTAVTLLELEPHMCKYPLGDPRRPDFRFCGGPRVGGNRPYCREHTLLTEQAARVTLRDLLHHNRQ